MPYPQAVMTYMIGIDVSAWQGEIDYEAVKKLRYRNCIYKSYRGATIYRCIF